MSDSCQSGNGGSGCGCISIILTVIFLWALIFGVTVSGKHYGLSCSSEHGVEIN